jgi:hypothetical protein
MDLPLCEHIKPGGARCGSPAVRDHKYCYHHAALRKAVPPTNLFVFLANPHSQNDPYAQFELPYLEDAAAIQIGFMQLIHGVAQQRLEQWRARMILSALHGAAANLRLMDASSAACEKVQPEKQQPASVKAGEMKEEETVSSSTA